MNLSRRDAISGLAGGLALVGLAGTAGAAGREGRGVEGPGLVIFKDTLVVHDVFETPPDFEDLFQFTLVANDAQTALIKMGGDLQNSSALEESRARIVLDIDGALQIPYKFLLAPAFAHGLNVEWPLVLARGRHTLTIKGRLEAGSGWNMPAPRVWIAFQHLADVVVTRVF